MRRLAEASQTPSKQDSRRFSTHPRFCTETGHKVPSSCKYINKLLNLPINYHSPEELLRYGVAEGDPEDGYAGATVVQTGPTL